MKVSLRILTKPYRSRPNFLELCNTKVFTEHLLCILTYGYAVCTSNINQHFSIPVSFISFVPHFSWCLELKSNGGRDFSLFSDIGIFTYSHTSSECREYQHFTIFLVSNENAITGNAHFRPSKTLHCFMSLLLTLYNHLTVFKHPPEKFFHCIWCFSQYLST